MENATKQEMMKKWAAAMEARSKTIQKPKEKPAKVEPEPVKAAEVVAQEPEPDKNVLDVIKSIKKTSERDNRTDGAVYPVGENLYCTDGMRALCIEREGSGIEPETDRELFGLDKLFNSTRDCSRSDEMLIAPDLKTLKELEKKAKEDYRKRTGKRNISRPPAYKFDNGLVVNVKYLMDGIKATGSRTFFWYKLTAPLLFESENGKIKYLLCPISPNGYEGHENDCYCVA